MGRKVSVSPVAAESAACRARDAVQLYRMMDEMHANGCKYADSAASRDSSLSCTLPNLSVSLLTTTHTLKRRDEMRDRTGSPSLSRIRTSGIGFSDFTSHVHVYSEG